MKLERLPKSRTENLIIQDLTDEILTYDLITNQAYCLNKTSAIVYNACDGLTTYEVLSKKHNLPQDLIYLTLDLLRDKNLLADKYDSIFAGVSRREVIKKVGLATMIALPMISGIVAPKAINAASGTVDNRSRINGICLNQSNCREGNCIDTFGVDKHCCLQPEGGGSMTLISDQSYTTDNIADGVRVIPCTTPLVDNNACPELVRCCDRSMPYGSCTYTPTDTPGYDPDEVCQQSNVRFVTSECRCTCP